MCVHVWMQTERRLQQRLEEEARLKEAAIARAAQAMEEASELRKQLLRQQQR